MNMSTQDLVATDSFDDATVVEPDAPEPRDVDPADVHRMILKQNDLLLMGYAIQATGKHIYQGTVPAHVKRRRRARGKAARLARKIQRRSCH